MIYFLAIFINLLVICKLFKFIEYPEKCNVGLWFINVLKLLSQTKEKIPIFVGGTGLYLESLYGKISAIPEIPARVETKIKKLHKKHGNSVFFRKLEQVDEIYSKKISRNDTQRLLRAITVKIATGKNLTYWHTKVSKKVFKKIIYLTISVDRGELYKNIEEFKKKYPDEEKVPRPPYWSGWILEPKTIEFWLDGENRIHERLKYKKNGKDLWEKFLLSP